MLDEVPHHRNEHFAYNYYTDRGTYILKCDGCQGRNLSVIFMRMYIKRASKRF